MPSKQRGPGYWHRIGSHLRSFWKVQRLRSRRESCQPGRSDLELWGGVESPIAFGDAYYDQLASSGAVETAREEDLDLFAV